MFTEAVKYLAGCNYIAWEMGHLQSRLGIARLLCVCKDRKGYAILYLSYFFFPQGQGIEVPRQTQELNMPKTIDSMCDNANVTLNH